MITLIELEQMNNGEVNVGVIIMAWASITADNEIILDGEARLVDKAGIPAPRRQTKKEQQDIIGLTRFYRQMPNEEAAIAFVEERVWGDEPFCPRCCRTETVYRVASGQPMSHRCRACKRYFSVRTGTVMEDTNLPIQTWLLAIHLMHTDRHGISSIQLGNMLDITQKTAWFLEHRIREAMAEGDVLMEGVVQVDETYIGGVERWKHADKKLHKEWQRGRISVIGLKEDGLGGRVIAFPVFNLNTEAMENAILDYVKVGSTVYTDSHPGYRNISAYGYNHGTVNHNIGQYVNGDVTNNGIESFWAILKGAYVKVFHGVSWKHLHRYVNECAARLNAGKGNGFRTIGNVLCRAVGRRLTYKRLIGKA